MNSGQSGGKNDTQTLAVTWIDNIELADVDQGSHWRDDFFPLFQNDDDGMIVLPVSLFD